MGGGEGEAKLIASSITRLSSALVIWLMAMKNNIINSSGTSGTRAMSEVGFIYLCGYIHKATVAVGSKLLILNQVLEKSFKMQHFPI